MAFAGSYIWGVNGVWNAFWITEAFTALISVILKNKFFIVDILKAKN